MCDANLSYASVHWKEQAFSDGMPPYTADLVDVAYMELLFRTKANEYAADGCFDFAYRIVGTGSMIVDLALRAIHGEPGSEERERSVRSIYGLSQQAYEESLDRSRFAVRDWNARFPELDGTDMPQELLELYRTTWAEFTEPRGLSDIKLGYDKHH